MPDSDCISPKPSCTTPVNGQCKTHAWTHESQPATSTANGCLAGDYLDDADTNTYWQWKCKGRDWGSEKICRADRKADGMCSTSYMECGIWTPINWSDVPEYERCDSGNFWDHIASDFYWQCKWVNWGNTVSCHEHREYGQSVPHALSQC